MKDYLPWVEEGSQAYKDLSGRVNLNQEFTVDSSIMHPNRSQAGVAYTLGNGKQAWEKLEAIQVVSEKIEKEK